MMIARSVPTGSIDRLQQSVRESVQSGRSKSQLAKLVGAGGQSPAQLVVSSVELQYPSPHVSGQSAAQVSEFSDPEHTPSGHVAEQSVGQVAAVSVPTQQPSPQPV
jgi:hypothetical protein